MIVLPIIGIPFLVKMLAVWVGKSIAKELKKVAIEIIKEIQIENNKTKIEKRNYV
jgi:hypothetical protein